MKCSVGWGRGVTYQSHQQLNNLYIIAIAIAIIIIMSDTSKTTTECKSCQLFLRVGIPAVVVFIIIVVGCIIWFDRYDKHQQQKKLQEKRHKKLQQQRRQQQEEKSFEDHTVDLSMYTIPSTSMVHSTEPTDRGTSRDLDHVERGHTLASPTSSSNEVALTPPSFRAQRFHALIQQVHDEHVQHVPDMNDDDDEQVNDGEDHHDNDDQSSIESDATPVVANNNTNASPFVVQFPPSKDIGLIRNHLSITGTTESESTSSSASSSSSSSTLSSSTKSRPVVDAHVGRQEIAVSSKE